MKKQAILITTTLLFALLLCGAATAAEPAEQTDSDQTANVTISGTVNNCSNNEPFPGVDISISSNGNQLASTTSNEDGSYIISFLSDLRTFNVTASYPGHCISTKEVDVSPNTEGDFAGTADFRLGNDVYVNYFTGDDSWDGFSSTYTSDNHGPKKTIQAAIDDIHYIYVPDGPPEIIHVAGSSDSNPWIYNENLYITQDFMYPFDFRYMIIQAEGNAAIYAYDQNKPVITIDDCAEVTIDSFKIGNSNDAGVFVDANGMQTRGVISGCEIFNTKWGVKSLGDKDYYVIPDPYLFTAIWLKYGIPTSYTPSGVEVKDCVIHYNVYGICLDQYTYGHSINHNHIKDNSIDGIITKDAEWITIRQNVILRNGGTGINLTGDTNHVQIDHNDLIGNQVQASNSANFADWDWYPALEGNFWGDYSGLDNDGNGVGNTPYIISGSAGDMDRYPLMDPVYFERPIAEAGGPYTGDDGSPILLDASGSQAFYEGPLLYRWDFDNDGTMDTTWSNSKTTQHTWNQAGTYNVKLEVTEGVFITSDTALVTINNRPVTVDAGVDQNFLEDAIVYFAGSFSNPGSDETPTVTWDFGDGSNVIGTLTPTHTYLKQGIYNVILTVITGSGSVADSMTVTIGNIAPSVNAGQDIELAENAPVIFAGSFNDNALDTHTLSWDFGDGSAPVTGTLNPTHIYEKAGDYTATLTVTDDDGGVATDTVNIHIGNIPPTVNAGADQTVTAGNTINFAGSYSDPGTLETYEIIWDFGDGTTATGTLTPTHVYKSKGPYTVTLTVKDSNGGVGSDTLSLTVNPLAVPIDIKPGVYPNNLNIKSKTLIQVAIVTNTHFDAATVDPSTIKFGATGTEASPVSWSLKDIDKDGDMDLILNFNIQQTGIKKGDTTAILTGQTKSGITIQGSDSVKT